MNPNSWPLLRSRLPRIRRGGRTAWPALAFAAVLACGNHPSRSGWPETSLGQVTASAFMLYPPAIAIDADGRPAVAYVDQGSVIVKKWDGSAWSQMGGTLNASGVSPMYPALTLDSGALAAAWEESTSSTDVVRAARFDGSSWTPLGAQINAANTFAHGPRIASGKQGLVAAYLAGNPYTAAVVTLWTGSAWQDWLPTPSQNAADVELALLPDGSPAVTWIRPDWQNNQNEVATRYWNATANAWASLPSVYLLYSASAFLAADADGSLFLATGSGSPQPMQRASLGATDWQAVGMPEGELDSGGPLVLLPGTGVGVAFAAPASWGVARYTGSAWELIATLGDPPSCFAGAPDGTLYVASMGPPDQSLSSSIQVVSFRKP
jgi:hypothetical protein